MKHFGDFTIIGTARGLSPAAAPPHRTQGDDPYAMNTSLDLTQEDVALLREVLKHYLDELHSEIVHTENFEFREGLQERQRRLQDLLERLGGATS